MSGQFRFGLQNGGQQRVDQVGQGFLYLVNIVSGSIVVLPYLCECWYAYPEVISRCVT